MMNCLISARFNMKMDVLSQQKVQAESGEIIRTWLPKEQDVSCIARGIAGGGIRVVGSTERWGPTQEDVEYVKIQTTYNMTKRDRVTNIRGSNGTLAWEDDGVPIVFEVLGSSPVVNPFGQIVEYDILVTRAEVSR